MDTDNERNNERNNERSISPLYINQYIGSIQEQLKNNNKQINKIFDCLEKIEQQQNNNNNIIASIQYSCKQLDEINRKHLEIEKRLIKIEEFYQNFKENKKIKTDNFLSAVGTVISTLLTSFLIGLIVFFINEKIDKNNEQLNSKEKIEKN